MITLDTSKDLLDNGGSAATLTTSYTNAGNILYVGVVAATTDKMSGVTFNGVAMTQLTGSPTQISGDRFVYLFRLLNPFVGVANVVITLTGTDFIAALAVSYKSANGIDVAGSTTGNAITSLSKSLVTTVINDWAVAMFAADGGTASAGASTTLRVASASFPQFALFDSNAPLSIGSNSINVNISGTRNAALLMSTFKPSIDNSGAAVLLTLI